MARWERTLYFIWQQINLVQFEAIRKKKPEAENIILIIWETNIIYIDVMRVINHRARFWHAIKFEWKKSKEKKLKLPSYRKPILMCLSSRRWLPFHKLMWWECEKTVAVTVAPLFILHIIRRFIILNF